MTANELKQALSTVKTRGAWDKAVQAYAEELLESLPQNVDYGSRLSLKADLLNGAKDWSQYSYGGSALIYDYEIAERVCSPSELKKTKDGERQPNNIETWLDVQARALFQASNRICKLWKQNNNQSRSPPAIEGERMDEGMKQLLKCLCTECIHRMSDGKCEIEHSYMAVAKCDDHETKDEQ